jgi:CSLREA domain-containing protein
VYSKHLIKTVSHLSTPVRVGAVLLLVTLALGVWPAPVTHAALPGTITVDTTVDELNGTSGNGDCSLREAIANANNDNAGQADCATGDDDDDVIILGANTYTLNIPGISEDGNITGDLDITDGLIINGNGAIIQAGTNATNGIDRVLHIDGAGVVVEINDATIRYGHAPDGADGIPGGLGQYSGGITVPGTCTLTLNRSTVTASSAGNGGDGIGGGVAGGWGGKGGGIYVQGTLVLNQSTVSGNYAGDGGNSTGGVGSGVYGNGDPGRGGGVYNTGSATFTSCTFAQNDAIGGGTGNAIDTYGATTLANTILASGDATNTCVLTGSGANTSSGYNLDDGTSCGLAGTGDLSSTNPNLAALADNGGPTWTHALQSPSNAIERIPGGTNGCDGGTSVDQRGAVRANGTNRGGAACEVGAYEYGSDQTPSVVTLSSFAVQRASGAYVMLLLVIPILGVATVLLYRRRSA